MKDSMKPCPHTLSDDVIYKEVVVIGNGPSGMVTSFMLAGNVPYLRPIPEDLPIDDMLRARLTNLPPGQSLFEADLAALAEGLEGRSHNPIPLLMDSLLRPCADLGIISDPLIEWRYEIDKQIDHVVLGEGPPGGSWHTFPPDVRTLSPGAWLALPPHTTAGNGRLSARAVTKYCRRYVQACHLQRYFKNGIRVTSVRPAPRAAPACVGGCTRNAAYAVTGYDISRNTMVRYVCARVVVCAGAAARASPLPRAAPHALTALRDVAAAIDTLGEHAPSAAILVIGSGVSAADAVRSARARGLAVSHAHRKHNAALMKLPAMHYPDYTQVYQMMCDGPGGNHDNYHSYPDHVIVDVTPLPDTDYPKINLTTADIEDNALCPKRVKLLNLVTNETTDITVSLIAVLIGSKPDLFFLQTNFNFLDVTKCHKCEATKHAAKRKINDNQRQCFLKNHWHYFKSVLGQSIQSCKSRYLNYTEINGNTDAKCVMKECDKRDKYELISKLENGLVKTDLKDCNTYATDTSECTCDDNPYSSGIGLGVDPKNPVDGRSNPIAIDKSTHELLYAPKGIYALGPLTADNFIRFIPGGALATVAHIHKEKKDK